VKVNYDSNALLTIALEEKEAKKKRAIYYAFTSGN
jgi:hypothetical protein